MTKLSIFKTVARFTVGLSVAKITNDIIVNNTDVDSTADKAMVAVGSTVVGYAAATASADYIESGIDTFMTALDEAKYAKEARKNEK